MDAKKISLGILFIGVLILALGINAYLERSREVYLCDACGMEIKKDDTSTFKLTLDDGIEHYACCPICAMSIGIYYENAEISAKCYYCTEPIHINIENKKLESVIPTGERYNISMVLGMACIRNKILCSNECVEALHSSEAWSLHYDIIALNTAFNMATNKVTTFNIYSRPVTTTRTIIGTIGIGIILATFGLISYRYYNRKTTEVKPSV